MNTVSFSSIFLGLVFTAMSSQAAILSNGSFETGDFTGWIATDLSNPFTALSVNADAPTHGTFAATSGFDGSGPGTISIAQDIGILSPGSRFTFDYAAHVDDFFNGGERIFSVTLRPNGGGATIHSFEIWRSQAGTFTDSGAASSNLDFSPYAGQNVRVSFELFVPGDQTGPGAFKVDNVSLTAVPEPATYGLVAGAGLMGFALWRRRVVKTHA